MSISRIDQHARLSLDENVALNPGWLTVELAGLPSVPLPHGTRAAVVARVPILAWPARLGPREPHQATSVQGDRKVEGWRPQPLSPDSFVVVGRGRPARGSVGRRRIVPPIANDNISRPNPKRAALRELFFLGMLAVTLLGAFATGRAHPVQKIIVIPEPMNPRSRLT
jgi:hypothetical protein